MNRRALLPTLAVAALGGCQALEFEGAVDEWRGDVLERTWPTEAETYEIRVDADAATEMAVQRFEEPTERCLDVIVKLSTAEGVGFYVGRHGDCP